MPIENVSEEQGHKSLMNKNLHALLPLLICNKRPVSTAEAADRCRQLRSIVSRLDTERVDERSAVEIVTLFKIRD
jgi:hypothetical protein